MLTRQMRELERQADVIEQHNQSIKNSNMNFQITSLAETMSTTEFIIELDNRAIEYSIEVMDDQYNANNDECTVMIGDMAYIFNDGELLDVMITTG
jgi:hypothetical protein